VASTWKALTVIVEFDGAARSVRLDGGVSPLSAAEDCLTRSVDDAAMPLRGIVNTYQAGIEMSPAGATVLSVDKQYRDDAAPPIRPGDLLLIIQMTSEPGGSAGLYEYALATSDASEGRLSVTGAGLGGGLINAYGTDGLFQVVRVPTFADVTTGEGLTAGEWDGRTGGVLAFDATQGVTVEAPIEVIARGAEDEVASKIERSSLRLLMGNGRGGVSGGIVAIRTSSFNGSNGISVLGKGNTEGGSLLLAAERADLSALKVQVSGQGDEPGGTFLSTGPPAYANVSGNPEGFVDTAMTMGRVAGIGLGVGCLPEVTISVSTSTPAVPRANGVLIGYQISVSNAAGRGTAENVDVRDFLPTNFGLESTSLVRLLGGASRPTESNPDRQEPSPTWSTFTLPAGAGVEIYFTATLWPGTPLTVIENEAVATYTSLGSSYTATFAGNSSSLDDVVILG